MIATWRRFWFSPQSTATLGLVRIAYGALLSVWALSLAPDLITFYATPGLAPASASQPVPWRLLWVATPSAVVVVVWMLLLVAALALTVGWRTRLASVVALVALSVLHQRNRLVLNSGDDLMRILGIYLMLAPAGLALSLDRIRHGLPLWHAPRRPLWALRLMQLQISLMYVVTVVYKLVGGWSEGTTMWYVWHLEELQRVSVLPLVDMWPVVVEVATFATLLVELALGLLVWVRRLRPWVLLSGAMFHLLIDATMVVGPFSWAVLVGYLAFVPPETSERLLAAMRARRREPSALPAPDGYV